MASVNTFTQMWDRSVRQHGEEPFLIFREEDETMPDSTWTYAQFDELVGRAAGRLRELGVGKGESVHMCVRNCPAFVMVWLAVARLGAWMVPVDPDSAARDINNQVTRTKPKVGVCARRRAETYREGAGDLIPSIIEVDETAADTTATSALWGDPVEPVSVDPMDRLAIMFTSGTTSEPKGVDLTQANYFYTGQTMAQLARQTPQDRWYVCLPLFHGNAQFYCFQAAIYAGASVALSAKFTASGWPFHVRDLKATHASLFAAPIRMILARRRDDAPSLHLKHVWFAQSLAAKHFEEFTDMCGVVPRQLYGMTETTAIVTANLGENPSHDAIGTVVPGREVVLLDQNDHSPVAQGTPGVITVGGQRGVELFSGYYNDPQTTAQAFPPIAEDQDWFVAGDLARQDSDGLLRFVGRIDDVIKVSGENVSLTEVEAALAQAPGVLEAAVLAVDDPIRDKVPVAYVVPRDASQPPAVDDLLAWADENLSPAARPREWTIIDELPRTSVGKIRRFKLTENTHSD